MAALQQRDRPRDGVLLHRVKADRAHSRLRQRRRGLVQVHRLLSVPNPGCWLGNIYVRTQGFRGGGGGGGWSALESVTCGPGHDYMGKNRLPSSEPIWLESNVNLGPRRVSVSPPDRCRHAGQKHGSTTCPKKKHGLTCFRCCWLVATTTSTPDTQRHYHGLDCIRWLVASAAYME